MIERVEALSWRVAACVGEGLLWLAEVLEARRARKAERFMAPCVECRQRVSRDPASRMCERCLWGPLDGC